MIAFLRTLLYLKPWTCLQASELLLLAELCPGMVCIRDRSKPHADSDLGSALLAPGNTLTRVLAAAVGPGAGSAAAPPGAAGAAAGGFLSTGESACGTATGTLVAGSSSNGAVEDGAGMGLPHGGAGAELAAPCGDAGPPGMAGAGWPSSSRVHPEDGGGLFARVRAQGWSEALAHRIASTDLVALAQSGAVGSGGGGSGAGPLDGHGTAVLGDPGALVLELVDPGKWRPLPAPPLPPSQLLSQQPVSEPGGYRWVEEVGTGAPGKNVHARYLAAMRRAMVCVVGLMHDAHVSQPLSQPGVSQPAEEGSASQAAEGGALSAALLAKAGWDPVVRKEWHPGFAASKLGGITLEQVRETVKQRDALQKALTKARKKQARRARQQQLAGAGRPGVLGLEGAGAHGAAAGAAAQQQKDPGTWGFFDPEPWAGGSQRAEAGVGRSAQASEEAGGRNEGAAGGGVGGQGGSSGGQGGESSSSTEDETEEREQEAQAARDRRRLQLLGAPRAPSLLKKEQACMSCQPLNTTQLQEHLRKLSWYNKQVGPGAWQAARAQCRTSSFPGVRRRDPWLSLNCACLLLTSSHPDPQVIHVEQLPPREARYGTTAQPLSDATLAALAARGVDRLFSHQVSRSLVVYTAMIIGCLGKGPCHVTVPPPADTTCRWRPLTRLSQAGMLQSAPPLPAARSVNARL